MLQEPRMEVHINKASWSLGFHKFSGACFFLGCFQKSLMAQVGHDSWYYHATMWPRLVELKPVRKFWWNKFKQHSREAWCNWPGKHPWREFLWQEMSAVKMSRQNWAASFRMGFETDDLGLEILSPLWVWSWDPNWRHDLWAKPWLRQTGLSLS